MAGRAANARSALALALAPCPAADPPAASLATALAAIAPAEAEPARFTLDPEHTSITFFTRHLGYADLAGMFLEPEGSFTYDEDTREARLNKAGCYPFGDEHYAIGVDATGSIRRSDFGMTYGLDNGWVGDEIGIVIGFEAKRQG